MIQALQKLSFSDYTFCKFPIHIPDGILNRFYDIDYRLILLM